MSKAIQTDMILVGLSSKVDGSLSVRMATPELSPVEKTAFFELQNKNCRVLIQPIDDPAEELVEVKAVLGFKTHSQRLRGTLYRLWEQEKPADETFQDFYMRKMDSYIAKIQERLQ